MKCRIKAACGTPWCSAGRGAVSVTTTVVSPTDRVSCQGADVLMSGCRVTLSAHRMTLFRRDVDGASVMPASNRLTGGLPCEGTWRAVRLFVESASYRRSNGQVRQWGESGIKRFVGWTSGVVGDDPSFNAVYACLFQGIGAGIQRGTRRCHVVNQNDMPGERGVGAEDERIALRCHALGTRSHRLRRRRAAA